MSKKSQQKFIDKQVKFIEKTQQSLLLAQNESLQNSLVIPETNEELKGDNLILNHRIDEPIMHYPYDAHLPLPSSQIPVIKKIKGSLTFPHKFNPFRNAQDRRKFESLATYPIQHEFDDPDLLSKLNKSPIEEIRKHSDYIFGNYDKYYNYRYDKRWQDPRLKILDKEYFFNKTCLDIGCNDGTLTIMIAIKYFPTKIVGIDIDYRLINKAIHNLQYFEKQQNLNNPKQNDTEEKKIDILMEKLKNFPKSFAINMGIPTNWGKHDIDKNLILASHSANIMEIEKSNKTANDDNNHILDKKENKIMEELQIKNKFPENVTFRIENFIKDMNTTEKFDTILCLSVTKWIHLNWGDCGVKRIFKKVHDSLNNGGIFILEPQDWRSYKKRKYMCNEFKHQYKQIQLRPHLFENYLVNRLGFTLLCKIVPEFNSIKRQGFKRPVYILKK